jgi:hypothetical protein
MMRRYRVWLAAAAACALLSGAALLVLLDRGCRANGGTFDWFAANCDGAARPVILQGDIHRV